VFLPVTTGTKSIKIDQETPELLSKTKWHGFLWLTVYKHALINVPEDLALNVIKIRKITTHIEDPSDTVRHRSCEL